MKTGEETEGIAELSSIDRDREEQLVSEAVSHAKAGNAGRSAAAWRLACEGFLATGRPIKAIAAAIEAIRLAPVPGDENEGEEMRRIAREIPDRGALKRPGDGDVFLAKLPLEAREGLVRSLHPVSFGTDAVVAREDTPPDETWFVVRGKIRVTRRGARGGRVTEQVVGSGGIVGECPASREIPRSLTLEAVEPTDLLELRRDDFDALLPAHPSLRSLIDRR